MHDDVIEKRGKALAPLVSVQTKHSTSPVLASAGIRWWVTITSDESGAF